MNNNAFALAYATALGALLLTSCTMEIDKAKRGSSPGVSFIAGIEGAQDYKTRTTGGGDVWVKGDAVGIYMLSRKEDIGKYCYPEMANKLYRVDNVDTGELRPDTSTNPVIAFPDANTEVCFVAYYPYSSTGANVNAYGDYKVSLTDQSNPAKIDVLRATANGVKKGPVTFKFLHSLSKITINIKLAAGVTNITGEQVAAIEDVKLMSTPGSVRVSLSKGYTTAGSNAEIPMKKEATAAKDYLVTFTAIVAPGDDVEGYLRIMFNGRPVLWSLPGKKFLQGRNHIYWGEITESDFRVEESRITTWTENDKGQVVEVVPAKIQQNYRITWDGDKRQYALTNDPTNGGLYFKFGSVVGVYTAHGGVQTLPVEDTNANRDAFEGAVDVAWDPTGEVKGDANEGWKRVPCYVAADFDLSPNTITPPAYHNAANVKAGKGDPCRLVGLDLDKIKKTDATALTTADIDNGKWRLPTAEENKAFTGREENGPYSEHRKTLNGVNGGMFPNRTLGDANTFLPATGYRHGTTGKAYNKCESGDFWSSTSVLKNGAFRGLHLTFYDTGITPLYEQVYSHGCAARCVRQ
jgi:hypothetical protein